MAGRARGGRSAWHGTLLATRQVVSGGRDTGGSRRRQDEADRAEWVLANHAAGKPVPMVANPRPGGLAGCRSASGRHRRRRLLPAVWAGQPGCANAVHGWESSALADVAAYPPAD